MTVQYGQYIVPHHDDMVNFGVGQPSNEELPLNIVKLGCKKILNINDKSLLQYGDIPGYLAFREELAKFLTRRYSTGRTGIEVLAKNLFVVNGVTGGLSLICSLYKNICKKIYVEEPTYFLAINIFKEFGFEIETINLEDDGLNLDELENKLNNDDNQVKLLYTIPTFHNPTSITLSHTKRQKLAELSKKHNLIILADEVYQLLSFEDKYNPPLPLHYYGGYTYSISSFSKILAPSLRLGWIQASEKLLELLLNCGQLDSSGGINPFISRIVHNIIEDGYLDKYLDETRDRLNQRCQVLCDNLTSFNFIKPNGGYFLWIKLPINSIKFLEYCKNKKIKFHTGNKFSNDGNKQEFIRLSFSFYDLDGLKIGSERLTKCYNNYLIQNNNINVTINGCTGRLGSKIKHYVNTSHNMNMHSGLNSEVTEFIPSGINDIIVDVSKPEGTRNLLQYLLKNNLRIPILIGTTGDLPYDMIKLYCEVAPVAIISNFSYGIPLLINLLKSINTQNWNVSIQEIHHKHKKDKPSGTAKSLSRALGHVKNIDSIREGEIYGIHKIRLENNNEVVEFYHEAKTRDIFAEGCLRFIEWLMEKEPGLYHGIDNKINVVTMSACGNKFNIIEDIYLTKKNLNYYCQLNNTDGLITYRLLDIEKTKYDFYWEYYNRDGSLVEMCGNGARCISKHISNIVNKNYLKFINNYDIVMTCKINNDIVEVQMPEYEDYSLYDNGYFIKVGVPHYVIEVNDINDYDLETAYNDINKKTELLHNTRCNVNIYTIKNNKVYIRTFEKGVEAETKACGTGCCAVFDNIKSRNEIEFVNSGGDSLWVKEIDNVIYLSSEVIYT